jgi:hypothetical protein
MVSHLSRYRKLIPALALVFALVDTPDTGGVIKSANDPRASFADLPAAMQTGCMRQQ